MQWNLSGGKGHCLVCEKHLCPQNCVYVVLRKKYYFTNQRWGKKVFWADATVYSKASK